MVITAKEIAELRAKTGIGMMECKKALEEADGDENKAIEILKKRGALKAAKRADREAKAGIVESYVHSGKVGVLVEVNCETDFVSRNPDFQEFAHEIALQIAAMNPKYVSREDVPADAVANEKEALLVQVKEEGKPADIAEKIVAGRLEKFYQENCLLYQPYVKDSSKTIEELLTENIAKTGEKIVIARFCRIELGI